MDFHAFVVMPFGRKPVDVGTHSDTTPPLEIDFDQVYKELLLPALQASGCEVQRGDDDLVAGDIRTQVLFELVTADLVVADVSTSNPNVFYELGIRHGVRPRGTLLVNGQWGGARPFDIAPDRAFRYNGQLFAPTPIANRKAELHKEIARLAAMLKDAVRDDRQVESSPLYAQLGNLKPVDWTDIRTSRAKYFGGMQDDWMDRVRLAQAQGYPGDILTLSEDAPTRFHRERLLFEAAKALINMGWFAVAEEILEETLELSPDRDDAQLQLGLVLGRLLKVEKAELHMRRIVERHKDDPEAAAIMGQVYRDMWRLRWIGEKELGARQRKAMETSQFAVASIRSYYGAQKCRPELYFNGFNVLILLELLRHLSRAVQVDAAKTDLIDEKELKAVVGFARRCAHDKAERTGDHVEQFWTLTTAAGLDLIDGYLAEAKQKFRDACNLPNTTIFEFQTIRERLVLLQDLDYTGRGVVTEAIQMVDDTVRARSRQPCKCQRVFLFAGCFLECQKISPGQLSPETLNVLEAKIRNEVETNNIGERDLVLSGLCHVSDVIFARACKDRGARVRLLVARQDGLPELSCPWFTAAPDWENKAYKLLRECETWNQDEHLGKPPEGRSVSERNQRWMANTARVESPPGELYALLLRNPAHCSETEVLERAAHRCGGLVHWIDIPPVGLAATAT